MKLTELEPRWVGPHNWSIPSVFYTGLTFRSPLHPEQRLGCLFAQPIDPDGLIAKYGWDVSKWFPEMPKWNRTGDTFETLTLSPSTDFSKVGDWHGHITNGDVL